MAYLLVAIGVLMSLVGLFAAISGYMIIEVERGWATVISGSTLLAGGLVTIALGLVLKTLLAIKSALDVRPVEAVMTRADPTSDFEPALRETATRPLVAPAFAETLASDHESSWLETTHAETAHAETAYAKSPAQAEETPHVHDLHDEQYEPAFRDPTFPEPLSADFASHEPEAPEPPHEADAYELQSPSTPAHDLSPSEHEPAPPAPSAEDDWLDRAFSDLDRELAVGGHPARVDPVETATAEIAPPPIAEHAPPPVEHAAPETAPALDAPSLNESAVIGRYDSEGTSYVMYADGSIEAQSEAGIYRFKSMAELKSFIEG